MFRPGSSFLIP